MTFDSAAEKRRYVNTMFARIARRYDLMNRLMTGGQDGQWRREVIRRARLAPGARLLDVGAGTGHLAREALRQQPAARVVAVDLTLAMLRLGQPQAPLDWAAADARHLPFPAKTFDAVIAGFLMRNVGDVQRALAEQFRLLKPGGRVVILDTTRPTRHWVSPLVGAHLHFVIPMLGGLISGSRSAYTYLPDSTEAFLRAEDLANAMAETGFEAVGFRRRMFGTIALHWGLKPS
jgi:demethylmenaquinone methyltransferase/2-methoxy-6-polyprenyl-1,4-benzoquinol methylase